MRCVLEAPKHTSLLLLLQNTPHYFCWIMTMIMRCVLEQQAPASDIPSAHTRPSSNQHFFTLILMTKILITMMMDDNDFDYNDDGPRLLDALFDQEPNDEIIKSGVNPDNIRKWKVTHSLATLAIHNWYFEFDILIVYWKGIAISARQEWDSFLSPAHGQLSWGHMSQILIAMFMRLLLIVMCCCWSYWLLLRWLQSYNPIINPIMMNHLFDIHVYDTDQWHYFLPLRWLQSYTLPLLDGPAVTFPICTGGKQSQVGRH